MRERRALLREAKDRPCIDCGNSYPWRIMHLDHVRGEKSFALSKSGKRVALDRFKEELAKCDPRCPTCHALRHLDDHPVSQYD